MKRFKFTIRGNEYEVDIKSFDEGIAKLDVNGTSYNVELHKEEKPIKTPILMRSAVSNPANAHKIKKSKNSIYKIEAPLPGNIMQIFVKEGDTVNKGDNILIYEAMKMENKLQADKEGKVTSIKIATGDSVLQGDILVELELT